MLYKNNKQIFYFTCSFQLLKLLWQKFKSLKILCGHTKNTKNLNYDKLVNEIEAKAA
jgi:hypothetical protein